MKLSHIADYVIRDRNLLIHVFDMPPGLCLTHTCEGQQAIGNVLCISMCVVLLRNNLLWFSSLKPQLMLTPDFFHPTFVLAKIQLQLEK